MYGWCSPPSSSPSHSPSRLRAVWCSVARLADPTAALLSPSTALLPAGAAAGLSSRSEVQSPSPALTASFHSVSCGTPDAFTKQAMDGTLADIRRLLFANMGLDC
jgi:hypothetical protein